MIKKLGFALALVAVMVACQSVEKKQQSWDTAKAKTNGYIAKYPVIAEELKAQLKQAEDAFKLAIEESDEKVKIDKMGDAVEMLRRAPMKTIEDFESQLKKTERIIADIKNEFTSEEFGSKTLFLIEQATPVINESKELFNQDYTSGTEALQAIDAKNLSLRAVYGDLDRHYNEIMDIRREKREQQAAAEKAERDAAKQEATPPGSTQTETKPEAKPAAPVMVKCKKCGTKSESGTIKCKSCGSNL